MLKLDRKFSSGKERTNWFKPRWRHRLFISISIYMCEALQQNIFLSGFSAKCDGIEIMHNSFLYKVLTGFRYSLTISMIVFHHVYLDADLDTDLTFTTWYVSQKA